MELKPLKFFRVALRMVWLSAALILIIGGALLVALLTEPSDPGPHPWLTGATLAAATFGSAVPAGAIRLVADRSGPGHLPVHLPGSYAIGLAERFAFTAALLLGLYEVAAVVVGVKALGQYQSDNNTLQAHRVLGTLSSVAWSLVVFTVHQVAVG